MEVAEPFRQTVGGVIITSERTGVIRFDREPAAIAGPVPVLPGVAARWDNRFEILTAPDCPPLLAAAVGAAGWRRVKRLNPRHPRIPGLSDSLVAGMLCLYDLNELAVPTSWVRPRMTAVRICPLAFVGSDHIFGRGQCVGVAGWCAGEEHRRISGRRASQCPGPSVRKGGVNNFGRNQALWIIIGVLLVALFNLFQGSTTHRVQDPRCLRLPDESR